MKVTINVPASSANLGPGFDVMGLSLAVYNTLSVTVPSSFSLKINGEGSLHLPGDKNNLIWNVIDRFYKEVLGQKPPELAIETTNRIPLARGLGSSAATITAAVYAANVVSGAELERDKIFDIAAWFEGHPDNVAAAVYGGVTIAYGTDSETRAVSFLPHPDLAAIMLIPDHKLSTKKARGAIPSTVSYRDAVFNISRTALLVKSLIDGDLNKLATAMEDRLHQPQRTGLIPEMGKAIDVCMEAGAAGAALSGAGPSILALTHRESQEAIADGIRSSLAAAGIAYQVRTMKIDTDGVRIDTD